ncbi:FHA domain containing protein [Nitzschia inconspicua]|uniref:FHA domain containing protein n=1 Tax=Nitzschia inconspicua TaxID=303405 RepID=A0A9K3LP89_9STRA|nr:FHA domain containing protein [Nitzschia inconspicua]
MISDFPYSVEDEPTEEWKVEHVLQWWLLRAHAESDAEYDKIVEGLSQQLEQGKKDLWDAHEQVTEILNNDTINSDSENYESSNTNMDTENENTQHTSGKDDVTKPDASINSKLGSSTTSHTTTKPNTIRVDIISGEYVGQSFDLKPQSRNHCWVGRSQGKKFRDKGISLPKDLEVSTSHGRFEYARGKFFYMDAASTNGSRIQDMEIDPNVSHEIRTGMEITVGQTIMRITLLTT